MYNIYNDIEQLLEMDSKMLSIKIGYALESDGMDLDEMDDEEAENVGRSWIQENQQKFRDKLCNSHVIRVFLLSPQNYNRVLIVAAIADLIIDICSGVPVTTVASSLFKEGIDMLCLK